MKILFVGHLNEGQTSRMRMEVLSKLGHDVVPLSSQAQWDGVPWLSRRIQQKLNRGPVIERFNRQIQEAARQHRPQLMWAEKQEQMQPQTLEVLRALGVHLLHFTPDPYFTLSWKRTALMDACMPLFDTVVTSKRYEMDEYQRTCRQVIYMPLGYAERHHRPVSPADKITRQSFRSDVGFLGGWEPRREESLSAIAALDCDLKIWGYAWDHLIDGKWTPRRAMRLKMLAGHDTYTLHANPKLARALQGGEVYGDAYAWALSGARISVGFLRHVCPDQHTTRTFEIPACASMMIADRTEEHQEFFEEGKEAEFFSSKDELVEKVNFYLRHEEQREKVARNGYDRCVRSGYCYLKLVKKVLEQLGLSKRVERCL